ncbi:MAG: hypothetical protein U9N46_00670 [Euryarchaeota archaeon]|nr:hypothetical protein [Euryarchaeota archaeon]
MSDETEQETRKKRVDRELETAGWGGGNMTDVSTETRPEDAQGIYDL